MRRGGLQWTIFVPILVILVLLAIFAPLVSPYPEEGAGQPNILNKLKPPSTEHLFGTTIIGYFHT